MVSGDLVLVLTLLVIVAAVIRLRPKDDSSERLAEIAGLRRQLVEQTAEIENLHSMLAEKSHDLTFWADSVPQILWTATPDGGIDYCNKSWREYTGLTLENSSGWRWMDALHPSDKEPSRKIWGSIIAKGMPFEAEYRLRAQDGSYRWFIARTAPVRDESGEIKKWYGTTTDIDDQRRAADMLEKKVAERTASLADSEYKIRALFNNAYQFIGLLEPDGKFLEINQSTLQFFELSPNDFIGLPIWESSIWGDGEEGDAARVRLKEGVAMAAAGHKVRMENKHMHPDGLHTVDGSITPVFDDKHVVRYLVVEGHDITEQKRANDKLKEQAEALRKVSQKLALSNRDLSQFAYVASHDLQEPLRTVISFSGLLTRQCKGQLDNDGQKYLETMVAAVMRMQQLIRDLLVYAQVEPQGKKLVPVNLAQPLELARDALNKALEESSGSITCDEMPMVLGDPVQLSVVFQNLFSNAIKFRGAEPPTIHVGARAYGDKWRFTVKDNGIGIKPEYANKIFEIFQRLHARDEYPGTGIGLSVCKRIIERHGGEINLQITEQGLGRGATFVFSLPQISH
jgi:PAS domain S-box-containing protein